MFLYEIPESSLPGNPTCISGLRLKDLDDQTTALSVGRGPGAIKWFDRTTSFVLPATGDPVFVLDGAPLPFEPEWHDAFLDYADQSHAQTDERYPAATLYAFQRSAMDALEVEVLSMLDPFSVAWSSSPMLDQSADMHQLTAPVILEGGLELLGYRLLHRRPAPGQAIELITVWRATERLSADMVDLRIFVHLLDDNSRVLAGEDRLDAQPATWEAEDMVVQYHRLPVGSDVDPDVYYVELGVYRTITMERLSILLQDAPVADRLLLQPIEVR
jgi:hypothetical protein